MLEMLSDEQLERILNTNMRPWKRVSFLMSVPATAPRSKPMSVEAHGVMVRQPHYCLSLHASITHAHLQRCQAQSSSHAQLLRLIPPQCQPLYTLLGDQQRVLKLR